MRFSEAERLYRRPSSKVETESPEIVSWVARRRNDCAGVCETFVAWGRVRQQPPGFWSSPVLGEPTTIATKAVNQVIPIKQHGKPAHRVRSGQQMCGYGMLKPRTAGLEIPSCRVMPENLKTCLRPHRGMSARSGIEIVLGMDCAKRRPFAFASRIQFFVQKEDSANCGQHTDSRKHS